MPVLDWSQCPAVESIPGKVSGAWVFRNTRMPVSIVFDNLEVGATVDEIVEWFDVTPEQVKAVIEFSASSRLPGGTLRSPTEVAACRNDNFRCTDGHSDFGIVRAGFVFSS